MSRITITIYPWGRKIRARKGENLLDILRRANIYIESYCGGAGTCGKCKVRVLNGDSLSEVTEEERRLLGNDELRSGQRLSCKAKVFSDMALYVPYEFVNHYPYTKKEKFNIKSNLIPAVKSFRLKLSPPTIDDPKSDMERICESLSSLYGVRVSRVDPICLVDAPVVIRKYNWDVEICVWMEEEIIAVRPPFGKGLYGLAIDIGTTQLGMYIVDLKCGEIVSSGSILNPQVRFGEDLITRLNYIVKKGKKGLFEMNRVLVEGLNGLIDRLVKEANISRSEIMDVVAVGNTLMHHVFFKINPQSLAISPFVPHICFPFNIKARELDLQVADTAYVHSVPLKAGFVGSDTISSITAVLPDLKDKPKLIIDIGTNGEIVYGTEERLLCASCATGPAFEGGNISHGMRARLGAIEKVKIERDTLNVTYGVIGGCKPEGICGSGIIDAVSQLFQAGLLDRSGRFIEERPCERLRKKGEFLEFVIAWGYETKDGKDITITQKDIRNVQLAKAALYAGAKILIERFGGGKPEKVFLAGSFGTHIDLLNAYLLGMFPIVGLDDIIPKGNLAGFGALVALLDRSMRDEAEKFAKKVKYVELSASSDFRREFFDALYIPHAKDTFL